MARTQQDFYAQGLTNLEVDEFVRSAMDNGGSEHFKRILDSGFYEKYVPFWLHKFGPGRVLVVDSQDLKYKPEVVLTKVLDFLDIAVTSYPMGEIQVPEQYYVNPMEKSPLSRTAQNFLMAVYARSIDYIKIKYDDIGGNWTENSFSYSYYGKPFWGFDFLKPIGL